MRIILFILVAAPFSLAQLPVAPSTHSALLEVRSAPPMDKRFVGVAAYHATAVFLDARTTQMFLRNPGCEEQWTSWLVGTRPSSKRLYLTAAATWAGATGLSYLLRKKGKKWWWLPQMAIGTGHATAAALNHFDSTCY